MSDENDGRSGVQRGVKRHESTTTSSEAGTVPKGAAGSANRSNQRRQDELIAKLPDSIDNAQERGERNDHAKAVATSGKSLARKKR